MLYDNYSCVKPIAPLRKTALPAEGQGHTGKERHKERKTGGKDRQVEEHNENCSEKVVQMTQ